jgi:hypothetical protein
MDGVENIRKINEKDKDISQDDLVLGAIAKVKIGKEMATSDEWIRGQHRRLAP